VEVVSIFNDKGGVGKTSLAIEIASGLAITGKMILLIDNDPQGTLSRSCLDKSIELDGIDKVYTGNKKLTDVIYGTFLENMTIVPCGINLKKIYMQETKEIKERVRDMFDIIRDSEFASVIDVVIIDNPPTQGGVAFECTKYADRIIIPSRPDDMCFDALIRTYQILEKQVEDFMSKNVVIFPSIVENKKMHRDFTEMMHKKYDGLNNNTKVGVVISNRAEVPVAISEKKVLYISHAASETAQQHKQMCLDVFPWLEKDEFYNQINVAAEKKKADIRERFKELVKIRRLSMTINKHSEQQQNETIETPEDAVVIDN
jgi:chromosome partitioning protein